MKSFIRPSIGIIEETINRSCNVVNKRWMSKHTLNQHLSERTILIDQNNPLAAFNTMKKQLNKNNMRNELRAKKYFTPGNIYNFQKKDDKTFRKWTVYQKEKINSLMNKRAW